MGPWQNLKPLFCEDAVKRRKIQTYINKRSVSTIYKKLKLRCQRNSPVTIWAKDLNGHFTKENNGRQISM